MARTAGASSKRKHVVDLTNDDDSPPAKVTSNGASTRSRTALPVSSHDGQRHSQRERQAWLEDEGDIDDIVGSSQDDAEGSDQLQHYGDLSTKIVGCRYYQGFANPGEHVLLRREPGNPYDHNAIRVDNVAGNQIGHIPRQVAAKLAKYMDEHSLRVEGQLAGYIGSFECPLTVHMFGPDATSAAGQSLQSQMQIDRLPIQAIKEAEKAAKKREMDRQKAEKARLAEARLAAATSQGRIQAQSSSDWINQNTPGGGTQPEMSEILEASQRIDPRQMANQAENLGRNEDVLKAMPMAKKPEIVLTEMLPYQLQALQWLLDQESPSLPETSSQAPVQLWTRANQGRFTNVATNYSTQAPKLASGGILADDMGLGKTLEMIALIAADAEKHGRGTTLVVAPLSVLSNWTTQVSAHIKAEHQMTVHVYHGSGRVKMKAEDLKKHDIVLTTYQTLASDYMPGKGSKQPERKLRATGLYSMEWRRVILDEGHIIRNPQSKGAAAVNALLSRSRWALTGTPIVNSLKDLYSLLRFIGVTGGLERLDVFNSVLVRPLKTGNESAGLLLQAIMMAFTLRRRKDMGFIDLRLPELVQYVNRVQFSAKERERYDALEAEAKGLLHTYEKKTNAGQKSGLAYNGLLEILLRMRQTCNHWKLCAERVNKLLAQLEAQKTVDLTPENKKALQDLLKVQIDSMEDCAVCLETLHDPVITNCGHAFGKECIEKVIEGQHKCPMCRAELTDTTCLVEPANEFGDEGIADDFDVAESSSKLEGLLQILHATKARGEKTVVFSQWTSFLDIVAARLDRDGYKWCRIDGSMRKEDREQALQALKDDDQTTILLASLGVCAVGLNLTAASNVVLCDTWWAPAIEDQAVDRVHRLGQTKETRVFRLIVDETIEEKTLNIQESKRKLMMLAFSERQNKRATARTGRLADIQKLLA